MRFLVVDDSPTMRRIVINALANFGFKEVIEAGDGQEALAKLNSELVDFVITDWNMPNMSGLDLTRAIRTDDNFKNIPILMVTTRGLKQDIVEALKARVNNYVVKPFTPQVLKEKIDSVLKAIANH
ncbi:MAG: two-component system, chemotaxis family, chemotaxis protein CheY [Bacteroidota bacterium]|nr:two-component system, chemotaxis family, chemotaxis protein CheY [Bacteroidota bacterium]